MLSLSWFTLIGILMLTEGTFSFQKGPVVPEDLELIRAANNSWGAAGGAQLLLEATAAQVWEC